MIRFLIFILICFECVSSTLYADPNDTNPCGQYNAYMGNICDQDKISPEDRTYPTSKPLECHDCHSSSAKLLDKTAANPGIGSPAPTNQGETDSAQ